MSQKQKRVLAAEFSGPYSKNSFLKRFTEEDLKSLGSEDGVLNELVLSMTLNARLLLRKHTSKIFFEI